MRLLDVLTREIYGRSHDEFGNELCARCWEAGKQARKKQIFSADGLLVSYVDEQRTDSVSVETGVADFLKTMAVGKFASEAGLPVDPDLPPDPEAKAKVKKFLERRARDRKKLEAEQHTAERRYYAAKALKNQ